MPEGTIAARRAAAQACTTAGAAAIAIALLFAFLPGDPSVCGSLLVPTYPPGTGTLCASAQGTWFWAMAGAGVAALALLVAGAALIPTRRR